MASAPGVWLVTGVPGGRAHRLLGAPQALMGSGGWGFPGEGGGHCLPSPEPPGLYILHPLVCSLTTPCFPRHLATTS